MKYSDAILSPFRDFKTKSSTDGNSIDVLDGIRGLAVLIVLASHTNSFGMYAQGSLGVLLFYFLSGFVLMLPFVKNPKSIRMGGKLKYFYLNRILRIVPIYVVVVAITAIYLGENFFWFTYNVTFLKGWNHFWSVAQEVRFYLLFPIVIFFLGLAKDELFRILILSVFVFLACKYMHLHKVDMMDGRFVKFYVFVFLAGCLCCQVVACNIIFSFLDNFYIEIILSVITVLIFLFMFFSSQFFFNCFWKPIFPSIPKDFAVNGWGYPKLWTVLFFIFFLQLVYYRKGLVHFILTNNLFKHLGLLSYSIYLFHMLFLLFFQKMGYNNEILFLFVFVSSYIVSIFTYTLIEKPFLSLKQNF